MKRRAPVADQAIVLGASIGGLLAARALSDHFARVLVLERDPLQSDPHPRKGVPQGQHTHGLLAGGLAALERFFPGIRQQLVARGAEAGDLMGKAMWHIGGGPHARFDSGLIGVVQSRPLLEQVVRQRLSAAPNVQLRDQMSVERLVTDERRERIVGVHVTDRRNRREELLSADLVVDATGRGSRMPAWLEGLGYERPVEERVDVDLAYATRLFERRPDDFGDLMALVITPDPPIKRFGVALAIEGNRWSLTVGGMFGDHPPSDEAGLREFARGLASGEIARFLERATPLSDVAHYRVPGSLRRHYEKLRRFPQRLLVMADAMCSFNPIYGQGMTTAALQAEALGTCLAGGVEKVAARFFPRAARLVDVPWQIAVTSDFQFRETRGRKPWLAGLTNAYLRRVHRAAHADPVVAVAFHRVMNLLDQPGTLMRPAMLARVLSHQRRCCRPTARTVEPAKSVTLLATKGLGGVAEQGA